MYSKFVLGIKLSIAIAIFIIINGCSSSSPIILVTQTATIPTANTPISTLTYSLTPTNTPPPTLAPILTPTPTPTPTILFTGRIAFISSRFDHASIYVMNADGSEQERITSPDIGLPNFSYPPVWSPNGEKIAYISAIMTEGGDYQLWVINNDGSSPVHLSKGKEVFSANWSPNSQHLVFACGPDIYRVDANGTGLTHLVHTLSKDGREWPYVQWLQDEKITFTSYRQNVRHVYTINTDGSNLLEVDESIFLKESEKRVDITKNGITFINPDDSEMFHMVFTSNYIQQKVKSPDGTKVAFVSDNDGDFEVYVFDVTNLSLTQLTNNTAWDVDPNWAPDSQRIAFSSNRTGNFEIYIMNSDGTQQVQLTFEPGMDASPAWQP